MLSQCRSAATKNERSNERRKRFFEKKLDVSLLNAKINHITNIITEMIFLLGKRLSVQIKNLLLT